jgi:hypothetical protein
VTPREQLLHEIENAPDFLLEEVLDFLLFTKNRRQGSPSNESQQISIQDQSPIWESFEEFAEQLPEASIRDEIGNLVLKANQLRDQAWRNEQQAISKLESLIAGKSNPESAVQDSDTISLANITYDPNAIPIWELAEKLSATIPDEEWAKLPTDLARNFDHYQQQRDDT